MPATGGRRFGVKHWLGVIVPSIKGWRVTPDRRWLCKFPETVPAVHGLRGLNVASASLRRLNDIFLTLLGPGMEIDHGFAHVVGASAIVDAKDVHLDPRRYQRDNRVHMDGDPGVVCSAIAVHTMSISCWEMPYDRRKSRAALALSTSNRSLGLLYLGVRPM